METKILVHRDPIVQGGKLLIKIESGPSPEDNDYTWTVLNVDDQSCLTTSEDGLKAYIDTTYLPPNLYEVRVDITPKEMGAGEALWKETAFNVVAAPEAVLTKEVNAAEVRNSGESPLLRVALQGRLPDNGGSENNLSLWQTIRNRTEAIKFGPYKDYIDAVLCTPDLEIEAIRSGRLRSRLPDSRVLIVNGVDAYNVLRAATEAFLLSETGVFAGRIFGQTDDIFPGEEGRTGSQITYAQIQRNLGAILGNIGLPYLNRIVRALGSFPIDGQRVLGDEDLRNYPECAFPIGDNAKDRLLFDDGFRHPLMMELIWSYWHEEGMLVQTINAITMRFQNRRGAGERDPLAHLELDSLRSLNNMLWGYLQEEYRRLSVQRRAYEYDHAYGLSLLGKAVPSLQTVDTRSRFLGAFHHLLNLCTVFYKQADDNTVTADPFPVLNALKEVHLILAEGAHNQFGDLSWTARMEMLIQQWLLARPEMNEYLRGRPMVPYEEEWMGRVDTMKSLQSWTDTTVTHFHNLALFGEQLLLSIRYTDWIGINVPSPAEAWALYWRPEIQGYIHAYRAATDVELSADKSASQSPELFATRPSELLQKRLAVRSNSKNGVISVNGSSPAASVPLVHQTFRERRAERK